MSSILRSIKQCIELIEKSQAFYRQCYADSYYTYAHKEEIKEVIRVFQSMKRVRGIQIENMEILDLEKMDRLTTGWVSDLERLKKSDHLEDKTPQKKEDIVEQLSQWGRGLIPKQLILKSLDKKVLKNLSVEFMLSRSDEIKNLLKRRVPRYSELLGYLMELVDAIDLVEAKCEALGAATGTGFLRCLQNEKTFWQKRIRMMKENEYTINGPLHNYSITDKRKKRYNNLLPIYSKIYTHMGVRSQTSLISLQWH
ncbi:MAG: hypothetical protein QNK25_06005 [Desulfobacterales bacterium]|nr:hypothetical protein [Desulfobacterales bacterium]